MMIKGGGFTCEDSLGSSEFIAGTLYYDLQGIMGECEGFGGYPGRLDLCCEFTEEERITIPKSLYHALVNWSKNWSKEHYYGDDTPCYNDLMYEIDQFLVKHE